jgi:hypothetical protein
MLTFRTQCPVCFTDVANWGSRCPKCHYHPDSYNRAQDDVAMVARYGNAPQSAASTNGAPWRRFLPSWLGGPAARASV